MTETERKALALVNEVLAEWGVLKKAVEFPKNSDAFARAIYRAIERHEAFAQEVSDAVGRAIDDCGHDGMRKAHISSRLDRFIIAKPDPLVEALTELHWVYDDNGCEMADELRKAVEARGGKIVWGEG